MSRGAPDRVKGYVGVCACGKRRYATKRDAKALAKRVDPTMSPYRCGEHWHLGHLSVHVKGGARDRQELRAARAVRESSRKS